MVDSYYVIFIRDWLEFSIAMVSLFCSFFTIYIIYRLKAWNGNILLITTLTCFQMLYDINFLFGPSGYYSTCVIWNFLDLLGGLGTSFTTNAIAFTMIYTVVRIRSINIIKNYHYIFLIIGIIPLIIAVLMLFIIVHASRDDDRPYTDCVYAFSPLALFIQEFYYWSRLASIIFNFVAFWYISFKIKRLGFVQSLFKFIASSVSAHLSSTSADLSTDVTGTAAGVIGAGGITGVIDQPMLTIADQQTLAVKILVSRMRFYPLAQAICRSGSAWDEFENYKYSNNTSSLMASICSPLSGVFYMIIFLVMQPNAWKLCQQLYKDLYNFIFRIDPYQASTSSSRPSNGIIPSLHLTQQVRLSAIFRESVTTLDDSTLESIINFRNVSSPDSNSSAVLNDWNNHLTNILMPTEQKAELPLSTFNTLHQQGNDDNDGGGDEEDNDEYRKKNIGLFHGDKNNISDDKDIEF